MFTASEVALEAFVDAGYDFVILDCQHGAIDAADVARLLAGRSASATGFAVRVRSQAEDAIGYALDVGADAVIVPMVESGEQVAACVAACRFAPRGRRSYGPVRASLPSDPTELEERASLFVMVETAVAVEQVEAICAVEGLAGVIVGAADLALSLGLRLGENSAPLEEAIGRVRDACAEAGLLAGIFAQSPEAAAERAREGFALVTVAFDRRLLREGARAALEAARGGFPPPAPS